MSTDKKASMNIKKQVELVNEFMKVLSVAHMCDVEKKGDGQLFYNGPSPDEVALVEYAQQMKFECTSAQEDQVTLNA